MANIKKNFGTKYPELVQFPEIKAWANFLDTWQKGKVGYLLLPKFMFLSTFAKLLFRPQDSCLPTDHAYSEKHSE